MHETYSFKTKEQFLDKLNEMNLNIPFSDDTSVLFESADGIADNRILFQPMEGCDGEIDGSPSELTIRRYRRFAQGGCGVIWLEATAVCHEGRANPRQLFLNRNNLEAFKSLRNLIREINPRAYTILQLTHSGRYSRPDKAPAPIVARRNDFLDKPGLDYKIITDDELQALPEKYAEAAALAKEAGFEAVDIKCCHGYLMCEMLGAFTRPGQYGGSFENRTRLAMSVIDAVKARTDISLAVRMNAYDQVPYPFGFASDKTDFHKPDLTETKAFVKLLAQKGVSIINITAGNPYYNPHVNRPYDMGFYKPPYNQLTDVYHMLNAVRELKQEAPGVLFASSALTWMRELGFNVAAGGIRDGWFDFAGFGRQTFAYPDFPNDLKNGALKRNNLCIACSKCTVLMRYGQVSGCVVRDRDAYMDIFKTISTMNDGQNVISSEKIAEHV